MLKKCRNLIRLKSGYTLCRIFNKRDRIGTVIGVMSNGDKVICNLREHVHVNYPGCPYNKEQYINIGDMK